MLLGAIITIATPQKSVGAAPRISLEEYVNRYKHIAIDHQQRYGIPASITMAQGILESDSGNSHLSRGSNNHFGIKCKKDWTGRTFTHTDDAPDECFRAYDSVEASYEDHAIFLDSSPRYDSLFRFEPTDYRSWARALKGAGYATAPDYATRLVKLIENNNLNRLDSVAADKTPTARLVEDHIAITSGVVDPNNFRVTINSVGGYNIYRTNQTLYVVAKSNDSYQNIAKLFGLSQGSIRRFNDTQSKSAEPAEGDIVYIEHKQNRYLANVSHHVVLNGENIHSISQAYGIKESKLRKLNNLAKGENPAVGHSLKLK